MSAWPLVDGAAIVWQLRLLCGFVPSHCGRLSVPQSGKHKLSENTEPQSPTVHCNTTLANTDEHSIDHCQDNANAKTQYEDLLKT